MLELTPNAATTHVEPAVYEAVPIAAAGLPTLLHLFDATVAACADRIALDAPDRQLTYAELAGEVRAMAERLRAAGVGRGDRVGVRLPSGTWELYVAILGVLRAGAAYVPVDADDPAARARQIFADASVCAVIGPGLEPDWRGPGGGQLTGTATQELTAQDGAWVIFTSGSTGEPKGVAVTHGAAAAFVAAEQQLWHVRETDRVLAGLSVAFDASCEEMWLAWANGAALVPAPRELVRAGHELGPWLRQRGITVISTVPALASVWEDDALADVRLLILGGEALPEQLARRLAGDGREVWNTYGPTEATVVSTAARVRAGEPVTIGWPLHGWTVAVIDADGEPVRSGTTGELAIGGVGLGRYLDRELDSARFAPLPALGWERAYRTGDMVRETSAGLEFVGRRDHQVKIGGRRIELGEIDAQLDAVPGVRAACTVVRETAAGNRLLVGYVAASASADVIRGAVAQRLPAELVPQIVLLPELPLATSGKVDRHALPWPPPDSGRRGPELSEREQWLADRFSEQLGPVTIGADTDFFELGGSSLAAAKLASTLRDRYPAVAVADVYNHRTVRALAARLAQLSGGGKSACAPSAGSPRRRTAAQLGGLAALLTLSSPAIIIVLLIADRLAPGRIGPQVGWAWLVAGWLALLSPPGRGLIVVGARRLLLHDLRPGRYPRNGWLSCRLWFVERVADVFRYDRFAGTPWAWRFARLSGHEVGHGAYLDALPPVTSLVSIGAGATIEGDVDLHGWWIEGPELVVGDVVVGQGARVGTRTLLMPGARIGAGAEIEPGSVVTGDVAAGERWAGSPAARVGAAGERWPEQPPAAQPRQRFWTWMFGAGMAVSSLLAFVSALPALALTVLVEPARWASSSAALRMLALAPVLGAVYVLSEALLVAIAVRLVGRLIRPGLQPAVGGTGWALWFTDTLLGASRSSLFALYATVYTRPWLRLAGIPVQRRAEVSTAAGITRLSRFGAASFAADDVAFAHARSRAGWLVVEPIEVGARSFLGNGAILESGTTVGADSLVGLLTTAPRNGGDGTAWLGAPALELPRRPMTTDPRLTVEPSRARVLARAATEAVRILLPATASVALAVGIFYGLDAAARMGGVAALAVATPFALLAAGILASAFTVAVKWAIIGRYRRGDHPLWSFFVWRDEIINSLQEELAGPMLMNAAMGTPVLSLYLRAMGATVGPDAWVDTFTVTEFDMVQIGPGAVVNRNSVIETHLFHDRVLQIGTGRLGAGATLGPYSTMLPDTEVGDGCSIGARSIVMRGERLPAHTRWHGAPVVAR